MNFYLAAMEPFLFWGGLGIYIISLAMYGTRSGDWKAIIRFWEPLLKLNPTEFRINRIGLSGMILAVVIRVYLNFLA